MAAVIDANDVTHGYTTTVPHSEIELLIDVIDGADACLDAAAVPESKQTILKIYAVRHLLQLQANSGKGAVRSQSAPSGASQSFGSWQQGTGVESTQYGAMLKQLDTSGCIVGLIENGSRVSIMSVGRRCV